MKKLFLVLALSCGVAHAQQACNPDNASGRLSAQQAAQNGVTVFVGELFEQIAALNAAIKAKDAELARLKPAEPAAK